MFQNPGTEQKQCPVSYISEVALSKVPNPQLLTYDPAGVIGSSILPAPSLWPWKG